jgi:tetratricopeptide (TPR) repeat protein
MALLTRWWRRKAQDADTPTPPDSAAPAGADVRADVRAWCAIVTRQTQERLVTHGAQATRTWVTQHIDASSADLQAGWRLASAQLWLLDKQPDAARAELETAIGLSSEPGLFHYELARVCLAQLDLLAAVDCLQLAVTLMPQDARAWLELGKVQLKLDCDRDAVTSLQTADRLLDGEDLVVSDQADVEGAATTRRMALDCKLALANAYLATDHMPDTAATLRAALRLAPDSVDILTRLANVELLLENDQLAADLYQRVVDAQPDVAPEVRLNFGFAKTYLGRWEEARDDFAKVLAANPAHPIARWYLCQNDLALCNWQAGWQHYGVRHTVSAVHVRFMPFRPWHGENLPPGGLLLILAEEGIGDEVMFAACFQQAIARAGRCIIECDRRLVGLFSRSFPGAIVVGKGRTDDISWLDKLPTPSHQVLCGDLPRHFRASQADFDNPRPYLQADQTQVDFWRRKLDREIGPGLKVGISWRGGTAKTRSRARTLPASRWGPILAVPGVEFISLQYGQVDADLADFKRLHGRRIWHFEQAHENYDHTAALVQALDLVITVCTAVVHLGGALGQRVWVLTPYSASWRYTAREAKMPWYAHVHLFRKTHLDDWEPVCHQVALALAELTKSVTPDTKD